MFRLAVSAVLLASGLASAEPRYISIGTDAVGTVNQLAAVADGIAPIEVLAADDDVAVLAVDAGDLEAIAREMHEQHGRCGGFMLHESREDAEQSLAVVPALQRGPKIDYALDRGAIVRGLLPTVDERRILSTIQELVSMESRYYKSRSGAAASAWLATRWQSFTTRPDVTVELVDHGYPQRSVIMTVPGTTRAHEVVVIGGHLDSISLSGFSGDAPGADDDASGIATLTEVARTLLAADYRPARTLKFMAYAAEEVGLRGSQAIAKDFKKRGVDVVGVLQLDMTNFKGSDKDIWLMKDFTSAAQNAFLIELIETYVGATWGLDACGYACSDHASWTKIGVPASMPFESRMAQRNKHIHTARDTLETSGNNAAHAATFARLATAYAIELGKGELATVQLAKQPTPSQPWWQLVLLALLGAGALLVIRSVSPATSARDRSALT
jgi:bacterial leucyl aminopeptidase